MTPSQPAPKFELHNTNEYRESYANSVQIRVNLWDFFLMFGTVNQTAPGKAGPAAGPEGQRCRRGSA